MANNTQKKNEKVLKDVDETNQFWLVTGERLKNLNELANALEQMAEDVFNYHVNEMKNDFSCWIKDCFEDLELAEEVLKTPVKDKSAKKIKNHINKVKTKSSVVKTKSAASKKTAAVKKKAPAAKKAVSPKTTKKKK